MSYFEYLIVGDLTPTLEERTNLLVNTMSNGGAPFYISKYYDEPIPTTDDKKRRTIVLTSPINIKTYLFNTFFNNCPVDLVGYYKQRLT